MRFRSKFFSPLHLLLQCLVIVELGYLVFSCSRPDQSQKQAKKIPQQLPNHAFVGDQTCKSCHAKEFKEWKGSDHFYSMRKATDEFVRGNFDNATFKLHGDTYRFYKKNGDYMVHAPGPDGDFGEYKIGYTFGWTPLQQYLIEFPGGKMQALNVAWDTEKKEWFSLYPGQKIKPKDWLHWTKGAMNWNTMCADCHSTNLHQNYIAKADSFHTTWSSIDVSCESCHGPGKKHVEIARSSDYKKDKNQDPYKYRKNLKMTKDLTSRKLVDECARCHARREEITKAYNFHGRFMDHYDPELPHPEAYYADGQIKDEDYVYASFLQSKMYNNGVRCTDCHNPHTLKLKANVQDNSLCMQCHDGATYNTPKHTFHKANTKASQCISCHMPGRYYMQVDFRRDHSFRIPRPDLSEKFDTPNACNQCHEDKSAKWAADAVRKWYGPDRPSHFSETLVKASNSGEAARTDLVSLIQDKTQPAIARATAIWYLGQYPDNNAVGAMQKALKDESPLVRNSAVKAMSQIPRSMKKRILTEALDDSVRAVRINAADGLADFVASDFAKANQDNFKLALGDLKNRLDATRYFPQGQMNLGQFYEKRGQDEKAVVAYKKAIEKDPHFNAARINLAYLYNRKGSNDKAKSLLETVINQEPNFGPAYYSLSLLLSEDGKLKDALTYFEKAADHMPENSRVFYNWAIALQNLKEYQQAAETYQKAIKLDPENPQYEYGIVTLYMQQQAYQKALKHAQRLVQLQPGNQRFQQLVQVIRQRM